MGAATSHPQSSTPCMFESPTSLPAHSSQPPIDPSASAPVMQPSSGRKPSPECASGNWSDGETSALIDAWGNARQRRQPRPLLLTDWRAAASAVNAHRAAAGRRFNRTRAQCQTRIRTLKKRYREELSRRPPSGWPHLPRLRAFLANPDEPPRASRRPSRRSSGLDWRWRVPIPRRPRNAGAGSVGFCPAATVMKLAEVYERVELARIGAEKDKMEMEVQQAVLGAVKVEEEDRVLWHHLQPGRVAPEGSTMMLDANGTRSSPTLSHRHAAPENRAGRNETVPCDGDCSPPTGQASSRARTQHGTKPTGSRPSPIRDRTQTRPLTVRRTVSVADARIIHAPTYIYTRSNVTTRVKWGRHATAPHRSTDRSNGQQHKHHTRPLTAAPTRPPGLASPPRASASLLRPARPSAAGMSSTRRRPPPPPPVWTPEPWSDGETSELLDAWGPRHLRARGGALRPGDWRACAAAVTFRRAAEGRAPRTVDQCKNRVDYLKKRLRAERARPKGAPPPPPPVSAWLDRLRALLRLAPSAPHHRPGAATTEFNEEDDEDDKESGGAPLPRDWPPVPKRPRTAVLLLSPLTAASGEHAEGGGKRCTEVAAALDRLAGTYELVEAAKQREATRLEERRLETMRDLQIERMRLLVDVAVTTSVGLDSAAAAATAGGDF
ncbi:hypothetical protein HU200_023120 [Digitaria exilis]|uniref:Myb/SANT-like DNA-binding domain-containing protein n=1 Tax=Digitaria exilis TaxID=1010633 RepID=A0A835C6F9_9POAL|nr:hypothetical protein HU200_023120 [Digitaria exilis]CAB3501121.1 unnamed protein product [Digitaria exilis]